MIRIGVDVGGTNTDAVILHDAEFVAGQKSPTTPDILTGVSSAISNTIASCDVDVADVDAIMVGTTHFVNAIVQRRSLATTGLIRLCLPSGSSLPPFTVWPQDLQDAMGCHYELVPGGYEMTGQEIARFDKEATLAAATRLQNKGCTEIALSAVFSTVRGEMETQAAEAISEAFPDIRVTRSLDIGRIGLLERENAGVMNAALKPLATEVVAAFEQMRRDLGFECPMYFTRNDGTLIAAEEVMKLPVLTFACGPTNSMRGAAYLSKVDNALVVDVGGTTSDVGELKDGFPRQAGVSVTVADVQTNFPMPDVLSLGLGGGTLVNAKTGQVGPDSVGHRLLQEGVVFGGSTLTASDVAVASGRAAMGGFAPPVLKNAKALLDRMDAIVADAVAQCRTSSEEIPVLAVGGGSVLLPDVIDGLKVVRPPHHDLANAVGAAIAQVSGEVSKIVQTSDTLTRQDAVDQVTKEAKELAIARGAIADRLSVLSVDDVPLAYLPGNNLAISVTVVGDLNQETTQ
ncbi:MAG: hydantoinase/oxoprolinase N-terminal domain-containing protein [Aliishimia sp.]